MKRKNIWPGLLLALSLFAQGPAHAQATETAMPSRISGSFVQPWFVAGWTAEEWKAEFADLVAAGVDDHVIWQWTVDSKEKTAYYPTKLAGFTMVAGMATEDPIRACLAEAKAAGVKVWLGLNSSDDWWKRHADDQAWLDAEFATSRAVADELWGRYGAEYGDSIAGFYLTMEVDNNHFLQVSRQNRMKAAYARICEHIHATTSKSVMIAPFCSDLALMGKGAWESMWENILADAAIDVINLQDGCGASDNGWMTHTTVGGVGAWFGATRQAISKARPSTELWSDLETFDMDAGANCFPLRDFGRIKRQIEAEKAYVSRFSSFAVMHYQTRMGADDSTGKLAAEQYGLLKSMQGK